MLSESSSGTPPCNWSGLLESGRPAGEERELPADCGYADACGAEELRADVVARGKLPSSSTMSDVGWHGHRGDYDFRAATRL